MKPTILAIDNDNLVLMSLKMMFQEDHGFEVQTAMSGAQGIAIFKGAPERFSIVLLDYDMRTHNGGGINGDVVAQELKAIRQDIPIVVVSGSQDPEVIQSCLNAGAEQVILKDETDKLINTVKSVILASQDIESDETEAQRQQKISQILKMVGRSREMAKIAELVAKFSPFEEPVLILGESGVGKEGLAKAVHHNSNRKHKKFVAINCASFNESLLESELFGHERGAFTGALNKKIGLFEEANGGTIFLDEIGDMPLSLQVKILRTLQEKTIQPVGAVTSKKVDFRIIAATHRNLKKAAEQGQFRQDLYYRLKYLTIDVPPLRERPEDIEPLVRHFLLQMQNETSITKGISDGAMRKLKSHNWPGNVRELEGAVKNAFVISESKITQQSLTQDLSENSLCKLQNLSKSGEVIPHSEFLKLVEDSERWLLNQAMVLTGNVKSAAALFLGMNHNTMNYRRMILGMEKNLSWKKGSAK